MRNLIHSFYKNTRTNFDNEFTKEYILENDPLEQHDVYIDGLLSLDEFLMIELPKWIEYQETVMFETHDVPLHKQARVKLESWMKKAQKRIDSKWYTCYNGITK